ncbi:MAG: DUF6364 family protein [Acidobacteriota bacterium]|nr:DUF6364 family protein [Acidobacteriota bacterium]
MRTTLDLDEDLIAVAKQLAEQRRTSMGRIVSSLMREALEPRDAPAIRNGVPLFKPVPGASKPSLSLVNRLRDEE